MNMQKTRILVAATLGLLAAACGGRKGKEAAQVPASRPFPQIQVPSLIEDRDEAMVYVADHYFDRLTDLSGGFVSDSVLVNGVDKAEVEQAVSSWCLILSNIPLEQARQACGKVFRKLETCEKTDSSSNLFEVLTAFIDDYLYDPNSPMRNEDVYADFAAAKAESGLYEPAQREIFAETARRCRMNQVGTKAADFRFSYRNGRSGHLWGIDAELTILFFSNPGCEACKEIIEKLKSYPEMEKMIAAGELAVANVYIDEDLGEWYAYMSAYPESWHNVYDPNLIIRNDLLYDVRAIPSLYLLNRDKIVLMKDAVPEQLTYAVFGY